MTLVGGILIFTLLFEAFELFDRLQVCWNFTLAIVLCSLF
jgi:hypothetical protein